MIYLGFDTSNYTTSVAACGRENVNIRKILEVKPGQRGLRQSDAVFQHMKELPGLFCRLCDKINIKEAVAAGVSTRPRSVEGSYMPVFLAGEGYAKVCSASLGIPLYEFSHQDGHIMAGIDSCGAYNLLSKPFLSVHLSGGTCEILISEYNGKNFTNEIVGGTKDISAGQLIDRVGVAMGLQFPCGKELEKLALETDVSYRLPVNVNESYINFSGIETKTLSLVGKEDKYQLSRGILTAVSEALTKALDFCVKKYRIKDILLVGGVISNSIIKEYLKGNLDADVYFASRELSTDNAVGISLLTKIYHENRK